jgi:hypothetical protein
MFYPIFPRKEQQQIGKLANSCNCQLARKLKKSSQEILANFNFANSPISFAEGRSVMPPWLYRDF